MIDRSYPVISTAGIRSCCNSAANSKTSLPLRLMSRRAELLGTVPSPSVFLAITVVPPSFLSQPRDARPVYRPRQEYRAEHEVRRTLHERWFARSAHSGASARLVRS